MLSTTDPDTISFDEIEQQSSIDVGWAVHINSLPADKKAFFYSIYVAADSVPGKWIKRVLLINDLTPPIVDIKKDKNLPNEMGLKQNYPNPFNPTTNIQYSLNRNSHVLLEVFDITGRKVKTLVNKYMNVGNHAATFTADNLSSSIFFIRFNVDGKDIDVKKMIFLK